MGDSVHIKKKFYRSNFKNQIHYKIYILFARSLVFLNNYTEQKTFF